MTNKLMDKVVVKLAACRPIVITILITTVVVVSSIPLVYLLVSFPLMALKPYKNFKLIRISHTINSTFGVLIE